jgi:hypothetical protein
MALPRVFFTLAERIKRRSFRRSRIVTFDAGEPVDRSSVSYEATGCREIAEFPEAGEATELERPEPAELERREVAGADHEPSENIERGQSSEVEWAGAAFEGLLWKRAQLLQRLSEVDKEIAQIQKPKAVSFEPPRQSTTNYRSVVTVHFNPSPPN